MRKTFNAALRDPLALYPKGRYAGIIRIKDLSDPIELGYEMQLLNEDATRYSAKSAVADGLWFADALTAVAFVSGGSELLCATARKDLHRYGADRQEAAGKGGRS